MPMVTGNSYTVMLEGLEDNKGFFVTYDIFAKDKTHAQYIAETDAIHSGLNIISCEEVNCKTGRLKIHQDYGVIKRYGKSYFDL